MARAWSVFDDVIKRRFIFRAIFTLAHWHRVVVRYRACTSGVEGPQMEPGVNFDLISIPPFSFPRLQICPRRLGLILFMTNQSLCTSEYCSYIGILRKTFSIWQAKFKICGHGQKNKIP